MFLLKILSRREQNSYPRFQTRLSVSLFPPGARNPWPFATLLFSRGTLCDPDALWAKVAQNVHPLSPSTVSEVIGATTLQTQKNRTLPSLLLHRSRLVHVLLFCLLFVPFFFVMLSARSAQRPHAGDHEKIKQLQCKNCFIYVSDEKQQSIPFSFMLALPPDHSIQRAPGTRCEVKYARNLNGRWKTVHA